MTSADALAILRVAVRTDNAPPRKWLFIDEARDLWNEATGVSSLSRSNARWDTALGADAQQATQLNLVGVLRGDVNGNWAGPAGTLDLNVTRPSYFNELASRLGTPTDVWGL